MTTSFAEIRRIEANVVDAKYRRFGLMHLNDDTAILRLLKTYGDISRELLSEKYSDSHVDYLANWLNTSLSHCLRWVASDCVTGKITRISDWKNEDELAAGLLGWGINYGKLATDFVAWSNGYIESEIDIQNQIIRFELPANLDTAVMTRQFDDDFRYRMALHGDQPNTEIGLIFRDWCAQVSFSKERGLDFPAKLTRKHLWFPGVLSWFDKNILAALPGNFVLGGYTLAEARQFYASVFLVCACIIRLEDYLDRHKSDLANEFGSSILHLPHDAMIDWLVTVTDLPHQTVNAIVSDMAIDTDRFHCSIAATPFVISKSDTVFLLPRLFGVIDPERTVCSALTTGANSNHYDRASTMLEQAYLNEIATVLRAHGFNVYVECRLGGSRHKAITPDLIIRDRVTPQILVIEFKNALGATGAALVTKRLREFEKARGQIERYLDTMRTTPQFVSMFARTPDEKITIHGLLLYRIPMPLPITRVNGFAIDSWFALKDRIGRFGVTTVDDLLPPLATASEISKFGTHEESIEVDDWTFKRKVVTYIP